MYFIVAQIALTTKKQREIMYNPQDPDIIWVFSEYEGDGNGSKSTPYSKIRNALEKAQPGSVIVLKEGIYTENVNIQNSGSITDPIKITSENDAGVFCEGNWYFYDVSDVIVSDIVFRNIKHQAISVIGACERNSFNGLEFINCGIDSKAPCTFFFGGSGGQCNIVENSKFIIEKNDYEQTNQNLPIGILVTEGDTEEDSKPNTNYVFRRNTFSNYGCAIVIGTSDENTNNNYSHIVENNSINNCTSDGIRIKCGDTLIRGNLIVGCNKSGINIIQGKTTNIYDNRITDCETGFSVAGYDCVISNNCIIRSSRHAIIMYGIPPLGKKGLRGNIIIERNTFINRQASGKIKPESDIALHKNTYSIIRKNIFCGNLSVCTVFNDKNEITSNNQTVIKSHIEDNKINNSYKNTDGFEFAKFEFENLKKDNYSNNIEIGAKGWMVKDSVIEPEKVSDNICKNSLIDNNCMELDKNKLPVSDRELYVQSLFVDVEKEFDSVEEDPMAESRGEDGIIDFSDWD